MGRCGSRTGPATSYQPLIPLRAAVRACKSATTGSARVGIRLFTGQLRGDKTDKSGGKGVITDRQLSRGTLSRRCASTCAHQASPGQTSYHFRSLESDKSDAKRAESDTK